MATTRTRHQQHSIKLQVASQVDDLTKTDAGWTYQMWAQFFGTPSNDRGWIFQQGSFDKTIKERVSANKVKVHDGHNWHMNATDTIGRVLDAREESRGCRYTGFLSRSHEDIADKLANETVSENSVEVMVLKSEKLDLDIEVAPEQIRPWIEITPEGKAVFLSVLEVKWIAIGLVSASSQDEPALISPPVTVSFEDLPVSLAAWDPAGAAERLASSGLDPFNAGAAFLGRCPGGGSGLGQIADIDEDGRLVVMGNALDAALDDLQSGIEADVDSGATLLSAEASIRRYQAKIGRKSLLTAAATGASPREEGGLDAAPQPTGEAEPSPGTPQEPPPDTHSDEGSREEAGIALRALRTRIQLSRCAQRARDGVRNGDRERSSSKRTGTGAQ